MPPEIALTESRALRDSVRNRTEALDRVKVLVLLPDGLYVTTQMVANYFEVDFETVKKLTQRHRTELETNGLRVFKGADRAALLSANPQLSGSRAPEIAVFQRRTVLNVGMLLRGSHVAQQVRRHLLDLEQQAVPRQQPRPSRPLGPGPHWDECEVVSHDPAAEAWRRVIDGEARNDGVEARLVSIDQRLNAHARIISAMSSDLTRLRYGLDEPSR